MIDRDKWDNRILNKLIESYDEIQSNIEKGPQGLYEDLWSIYFKPVPRVKEDVQVPWKSIIEDIMQTQDYSNTHDTTMLDESLSAFAACASFNEFAKQMEENPKLKDFLTGKNQDQNLVKNELLWMPAQVTSKVKQEVKEVKDALEMGGYSKESKNNSKKISFDEINKLRDRLNSPIMKKVMNLWGRMKNVVNAIQRKKTVHGVDEVDEVGFGRDLNRILPVEIINWKLNPNDFKKRYSERRLNQITYKGVELKGKGPIIVLVDTSGSMYGNRIQWAKALAVTMLEIGKKQKRNVIFHDFADEDETYDLSYEGKQVDTNKLFDYIEHFYNGGTNWDYPLKKALKELKSQSFKDGQILLITDGESILSDNTRKEILREREENKVSVKSIVIGGYIEILNSFCDEVINIKDLSKDDEVLNKVFNI